MRYLHNFKLFESIEIEPENGDDIDLFTDLLQEYFDKYKIYNTDDIESAKKSGSTINGQYHMKRVSTNYFKVNGFPDHSSGILIEVNLYKHDELRETVAKDLAKFVYRIKKMGYEKIETEYDDRYGLVRFYIAIVDNVKNESKSNNLEMCRPLTRAEYDNFFSEHETNRFKTGEIEKVTQILSEIDSSVEWTGVTLSNGEPSDFQSWYIDGKAINITKFEDHWFLVEEMWYNSWNKDPHYYLCDELDSIKYIDFYA